MLVNHKGSFSPAQTDRSQGSKFKVQSSKRRHFFSLCNHFVGIFAKDLMAHSTFVLLPELGLAGLRTFSVETTLQTDSSASDKSEKSLSKNGGRKIFEACFRHTFFAPPFFTATVLLHLETACGA